MSKAVIGEVPPKNGGGEGKGVRTENDYGCRADGKSRGSFSGQPAVKIQNKK